MSQVPRMPSPMETTSTGRFNLAAIRCAIYTRQSQKSDAVLSSCEAQEMVCRDLVSAASRRVTASIGSTGMVTSTRARKCRMS